MEKLVATGKPGRIEVTILMPCLNEEENIQYCVQQAQEYIKSRNLSGEVLIVDNMSTDGSVEKASQAGARVVTETQRGYGSALRRGINEARGEVIIFGDCDTTYDFSELDPFYEPLANGACDIVIGDRRNLEKGAMSLSHRLGVPFLSWLGRVKFKVKVHDFHCGLRGLTREAAGRMELKTPGMEFATEMIAEAGRKKMRIAQVPITLHVAKAKRREKLRTIRDGLRHVWYIFTAHI